MNIGTILPFLATKVPDGWLSCENGAEISRTTYPELWAWVQENAPLVSETEWQTLAVKQTSVGYYSSGDGSTTFRLPRIVDFIQGSAPTDSGKFTEAGLPNITGETNVAHWSGTDTSGAITTTEIGIPLAGATIGSTATCKKNTFSFDASKSNAVYGKSTTVQPASVKMVYCVRAFGALTNQGTIDVTSLANDKLSKTDIPTLCTGRIVAQSLDTNGWVKFDNGLILQWGIYDGKSTPDDNSAINNVGYFPIAFPNKALGIVSNTQGLFTVAYMGEIYGASIKNNTTFIHSFFRKTESLPYKINIWVIGY